MKKTELSEDLNLMVETILILLEGKLITKEGIVIMLRDYIIQKLREQSNDN